MESYKQHFSRSLSANDTRLHFAAHSHHLWPDCTEAAHQQAWLDAAMLADDKWERIFGQVMPEAQAHIAKRLSLPDPMSICFAPNTHEFLVRLHSALPDNPSVLTTDAEFHSFTRQRRRWEEAESTEFEVVPAEPFEDFGARFLKSAARYEHDMIYISQVFFNSGYVVEILDALVDIVRGRDTLVVIDGYHAFMALPVSLETIADRVFYIAGGYKYAMAGEGACFMHCPPGFAMRPVNTGWFAGFGDLEGGLEQINYSSDGRRFAGATFDSCGLHRFNAVQRLFDELDLSVLALHERIQVLQSQFLDGLVGARIALGEFIPGAEGSELGHFLTFRSPRAESITDNLAAQGVMVDFRKDRLRIGFALYHDPEDVVALLERLEAAEPKVQTRSKADAAIDSAIQSAIATESRVTGPFEAVAIPDAGNEAAEAAAASEERAASASDASPASASDASPASASGQIAGSASDASPASASGEIAGSASDASADEFDDESGSGVVETVVLGEESVGSKFDATDVDDPEVDALGAHFIAPASGSVTKIERAALAKEQALLDSSTSVKKKKKKKRKKKSS